MKSRKWYRRRHKAEWRQEQYLMTHPVAAALDKANEQFNIAVTMFSEQVLKPYQDAFGVWLKKFNEDLNEMGRLLMKSREQTKVTHD